MAKNIENLRDDAAAIAKTDTVADITKLDDHLSKLYRDAVGAQDSTSAVPVVKVVLLNLIVYSRNEEDAVRVMSSVGRIIGLHPCRSIVVDDIPSKSGEPPATVSLVCGITERGDRTLCGDIIRIHVHEDSAGAIGSVMPLLVPDVPVFLWITGEIPDDSEAFDDLLDVADYVISDSRRFGDLALGLSRFLGLQTSDDQERAVHDLCWTNIHAWRESIAQHFDPTSTRQYLMGLNEIVIRYSGGAGDRMPQMTPLLLSAWLIERTGMDLVGVSFLGAECRIDARQDDRPVQISMISEQSDAGQGRLSSVTIKATGENGVATFFTQGSGSEVSVSEECAGICFSPRTIEIPPEEESFLVSQILGSYKRDNLYMDVAHVVLRILNTYHER